MTFKYSLVATLVLAACATAPPQSADLSFEQAQTLCFDQTVAGVATKPGETVRASLGIDGSFRGGVFKDGFLRGNVSGAPYDACMAEKIGALVRGNQIEVATGVLLSPTEKLTWDQMSPAEREQVRLFMINGGTFASAPGGGA